MRQFLIALAVVAALPALAGPHDAAYYKRTGTKPPMPPGEFVIGPSLHYSEQLSAGLTFGYRWHNGVQLLGDYSLMRVDAVSGTTQRFPGFPLFDVPYTVNGYSRGQAAVTVLFPIKKLVRPAK